MPYEVELRESDGYVLVTYTGRATTEDLERSAAEALPYIERLGISRLLVDALACESTPDVAAHYDVQAAIYEGPAWFSRAAIVEVDDRGRTGAATLLAEVAEHRGAAFRVFHQREAALAWLLGEGD